MNRICVRVGLVFLGVFLCDPCQSQAPIHERIEWSDLWVTDADKEDLPRILLVGDSIVRGYFSQVEKHLKGKAYCARYTTSKFMGNPDFLEELKTVLARYRFAIVHINNGLHGWGYTEEEYKESFGPLLDLLKEQAPDARIVWATTTPVRSEDLSQFAEKTERVRERNAIASEILSKMDIETNDLFALVESHPEYYSKDGTHFNSEGNEILGKAVAEAISERLAD